MLAVTDTGIHEEPPVLYSLMFTLMVTRASAVHKAGLPLAANEWDLSVLLRGTSVAIILLQGFFIESLTTCLLLPEAMVTPCNYSTK